MTKLKTPEYYLDEVAKERGKLSFIQATDYAPWAIKDIVKEAMLRHSKEACEEQRASDDRVNRDYHICKANSFNPYPVANNKLVIE